MKQSLIIVALAIFCLNLIVALIVLIVLYSRRMLEPMPYQCLVINMDSRKDRLAHFTTRYNSSDLNKISLVRIPAVVGKELDWRNASWLTRKAKEDMLNVELYKSRTAHANLMPGAIGCYWSHIHAWRMIAKSQQSWIVFEDDLTIPKDFKKKADRVIRKLPKKGAHVLSFQNYNLYEVIPDNKLVEIHSCMGTACYYITPSAARILLDAALPMQMQVDFFMTDCALKNLITMYSYRFVHQNEIDSDIQQFALVPK